MKNANVHTFFFAVVIANFEVVGFTRKQKYTECGPSRGVEENVLVTECMDYITSHLASCHLSKCSKCSKDNENELILARVRIRGLVGIWN